jgi:hypothetical protein
MSVIADSKIRKRRVVNGIPLVANWFMAGFRPGKQTL